MSHRKAMPCVLGVSPSVAVKRAQHAAFVLMTYDKNPPEFAHLGYHCEAFCLVPS